MVDSRHIHLFLRVGTHQVYQTEMSFGSVRAHGFCDYSCRSGYPWVKDKSWLRVTKCHLFWGYAEHSKGIFSPALVTCGCCPSPGHSQQVKPRQSWGIAFTTFFTSKPCNLFKTSFLGHGQRSRDAMTTLRTKTFTLVPSGTRTSLPPSSLSLLLRAGSLTHGG